MAKRFALVVAVAVMAGLWAPAVSLAQTGVEPEEQPRTFGDLADELGDAWRRLLDEVQPHLEGLDRMMAFFEGIDDIGHYEEPQILPNGDIIIRRRADAPPLSPGDEPEQGSEGDAETASPSIDL